VGLLEDAASSVSAHGSIGVQSTCAMPGLAVSKEAEHVSSLHFIPLPPAVLKVSIYVIRTW